MRFLPTIIAAAILLVAMTYTDWVHQENLTRENRNSAATALGNAQLAYASSITGFVRDGVKMGAKMPVLDKIGQNEFEALANQTVASGGQIVRAEFAPGYVTTIVSPRENNLHRIGSPPTLQITDEETETKGNPRRVFPVVRKVRLIDNQSSEIGLLVPLVKRSNDVVLVAGVVFIVARFDLDLPEAIDGSGVDRLEHLFKWLPGGRTEDAIPQEWQTEGDMEPVGGTIDVPGGAFLNLARSLDGWAPTFDEMLGFRLRLFAYGLVAFIVALLANWVALSHRSTSHRLTEAEDQMSGVLRNLPGAALTYTMPASNEMPGPEDQIAFLNKSACRNLWGIKADVAEADVMALWDCVDTPEAVDEFSQALADSAKNMSPLHYVWSIHTPAGQQKWLDGRGHPTRLNDGSVQWSAMIHDATDQIEHKQELEQQRDLAHSAQKRESIGQLTGGVAHDFNNLLAVIMGSLEILRDELSDDKRLKLIDTSLNATKRGAELTQNMLAFARKARLSPKVIELNKLVRDVRSWTGRTIPASISVETSLLAGLWQIEADPSSTESALLNLILNARDAMPDGGRMTIETANVRIEQAYADSRKEDLKPGRYVMLAVSDTGHGITEEVILKIFEPFYSTKPPGAGSGLGLSMIQGFMQQSGGTVQVYTEPDVGTTFKLYFRALTTEPEATKYAPNVVSTTPAKGRKILVTEDEAGVRSVLVATLEKAGYLVTPASNGDEARSIFEADPSFDLLLTDIVMPGSLQGTTLSRVLREQEPELRVVFMSGYASEATVHGNGLRPEDIRLMKPVMRADLLAAIQGILGD